MIENIRRIPRPKGATQLGYQLSKDYTRHNVSLLRAHIIRAFINQNLYWPYQTETRIKVLDKEAMKAANKAQRDKAKEKDSKTHPSKGAKNKNKKLKPIKLYKELYVEDIRQVEYSMLASLLVCSQATIDKRLNKAYEKDASIMATQQGQINVEMMTRASQNRAFFGLLERYPTIMGWAEELKAVARLRGYTPGTIMAANTALNQEMQALNMVHNMASRMLTQNNQKGTVPGHPTVNIQNNVGNVPGTQNGQFLTATMAQKMLEEQGLTKVPLDLPALSGLYGIHSGLLPEIEAIESDAQGTQMVDIEALGFKTQLEESEEVDDHHEARRAKELGIIDGLAH